MKVLIETHDGRWINYDAVQEFRVEKFETLDPKYRVTVLGPTFAVHGNNAYYLNSAMTPQMSERDAKGALRRLIGRLRPSDDAGFLAVRYADWN